jgi:hypothetical protein
MPHNLPLGGAVEFLYPIRLEASLHETIWGGRRLQRDGWKHLPVGDIAIGEAWETEVSTVVQNGPYAGQTLGELVELLGPALLGEGAMAIFGGRLGGQRTNIFNNAEEAGQELGMSSFCPALFSLVIHACAFCAPPLNQ